MYGMVFKVKAKPGKRQELIDFFKWDWRMKKRGQATFPESRLQKKRLTYSCRAFCEEVGSGMHIDLSGHRKK